MVQLLIWCIVGEGGKGVWFESRCYFVNDPTQSILTLCNDPNITKLFFSIFLGLPSKTRHEDILNIDR